MVSKDFCNRVNKTSAELKLYDTDRKSHYIRTSNGKLFLKVTVHLWKTVKKLLL